MLAVYNPNYPYASNVRIRNWWQRTWIFLTRTARAVSLKIRCWGYEQNFCVFHPFDTGLGICRMVRGIGSCRFMSTFGWSARDHWVLCCTQLHWLAQEKKGANHDYICSYLNTLERSGDTSTPGTRVPALDSISWMCVVSKGLRKEFFPYSISKGFQWELLSWVICIRVTPFNSITKTCWWQRNQMTFQHTAYIISQS